MSVPEHRRARIGSRLTVCMSTMGLVVFRIYDVNNDGYISNGDLFAVLKIMVGDNLTEVQLQQLVDRTIATGDTDCDGKLSFEEFSKVALRRHLNTPCA